MKHEILSPGTLAAAEAQENTKGASSGAPEYSAKVRWTEAESAAEARIIYALVGFNLLTADEQELFVERLAILFPEVVGPMFYQEEDPFWMDRADHRRVLLRSWRALPDEDRRASSSA